MFTWVWIFEIVLFGAVAARGPGELAANASSPTFYLTSCKEFEHGARLAPHDVVDSLWRIFYFWAYSMEISPILFTLPTEKKVNTFKAIVDAVNPELEVKWSDPVLFMEPRPGVQVLFIDSGHGNAFRALVKKEQRDKVGPQRIPHIQLTDVRMKTVDRYLGIINCDDHTAFALARTYEMPETEEECRAAVASLNLNSLSGKPYLYIEQKLHAIDEL